MDFTSGVVNYRQLHLCGRQKHETSWLCKYIGEVTLTQRGCTADLLVQISVRLSENSFSKSYIFNEMFFNYIFVDWPDKGRAVFCTSLCETHFL